MEDAAIGLQANNRHRSADAPMLTAEALCQTEGRFRDGDDVAWHAEGGMMIVVVLPATKPKEVRR